MCKIADVSVFGSVCMLIGVCMKGIARERISELTGKRVSKVLCQFACIYELVCCYG